MPFIGSVLLLMVIIGSAWAYRRYVPVRGLKHFQYTELDNLTACSTNVQLLDVRDYLEYEKGHYKGAINISIGRLSTYWMRELVLDRPIVIIADRHTEAYVASRFLRKKGFGDLSYALFASAQAGYWKLHNHMNIKGF